MTNILTIEVSGFSLTTLGQIPTFQPFVLDNEGKWPVILHWEEKTIPGNDNPPSAGRNNISKA